MPKAASSAIPAPVPPRAMHPLLLTASCLLAAAAMLCRNSQGELLIHAVFADLLVLPLAHCWIRARSNSVTPGSIRNIADLAILVALSVTTIVVCILKRSLEPSLIILGGYLIGTTCLDASDRLYSRIVDALHDPRRLVRVIAPPWLLCILIAAILLALPIATQSGVADYRHNFVSHIVGSAHSAVSAACLTGTFTLDFANDYTRFGQIVIVLLTQISGLAFAAVGLSLVRPLLLRPPSLKTVLSSAVLLQLAGCAVLVTAWRSEDASTIVEKCWWSIVHAGSAMWNTSITMRPDGIATYIVDRRVFLTITTLAIAGSLGIPILYELLAGKSSPNSESNVRLGRIATFDAFAAFILLLLTSAALFYLEHPASVLGAHRPPLPFEPSVNQPAMVDSRGAPWVLAVLVSATIRSAGLQSIPASIGTLSWGAYGLILASMFVGGSVAGTAGGIRTSMFGLFFTASSKKERAPIPGKQNLGSLRQLLFTRVLMGVGLWIVFNLAGTVLLGATTNADRYDTAFEAIAAINNVGMTTGLSTHLTTNGRLVAIILMLTGRLWPLFFWAGTIAKIIEYRPLRQSTD